MPAPKNNINAVKPVEKKASTHLHIRVVPREKAAFERQAISQGKSLAAWVIQTLNKELECSDQEQSNRQ